MLMMSVNRLTGRQSIAWQLDLFHNYDAVLICTDHDCVDFNAIVDNAALVVDTRNATKSIKHGREKIVLA
jgi:UDP-N-acetyl-D-glucosamine dehydrogenase